MLDNLKGYNIILASKSPRRKELLSMLGLKFDCRVMEGIDERYPDTLRAGEVPEFLANLKGEAYKKTIGERDLIITADTIVVSDDKILGKPKNREDALLMLAELSGKEHEVLTGVSVLTKESQLSFTTSTKVKFDNITADEARYYVDKYNPVDKAGAYGIQEWIGCVAVERIDGSFYNVMGLPVNRLYQALKKIEPLQ